MRRAVLAAALLCLSIASAARAEDRVYWLDDPSTAAADIAFAALDGSGGARIPNPGGVSVDDPTGLAIDTVGEGLYWTDHATNAISFATLTGSNGGALDTGSTTVGAPTGIAIDPVSQRVYWIGHFVTDGIFFANLDGSGGAGRLDTSGATFSAATSLAIDRSAGRIYWANQGSPAKRVSFANLDGSGHGGDVNTAGAASISGDGIAIDHANGRLYWADPISSEIFFAGLDGSGGHELQTSAPLSSPIGVAIDPVAGLIYWANQTADKIAVANLDGSGGRALETPGMTPEAPLSPVLLVAPRSTAPPAITGESEVGSDLTCSEGTWAPDVLESSFYDAPHSFSYQWILDGAEIPGATDSTLTAESDDADYRCRVTATNFAGTRSVTSAPHRIPPTAFGRETRVVLTLASRLVAVKGPVPVRIANGNGFAVSGRLSGQTNEAIGSRHKKRRIRLGERAFEVAAEAAATVKLSLPKPLQRLLARRHKVSLALSATVSDTAQNSRTIKATVVAKVKARAKKHRAGAGGRD